MSRDKQPMGSDWRHELGKNWPSDSVERLESRMAANYSKDITRLNTIKVAVLLVLLVVGGIIIAYLRGR